MSGLGNHLNLYPAEQEGRDSPEYREIEIPSGWNRRNNNVQNQIIREMISTYESQYQCSDLAEEKKEIIMRLTTLNTRTTLEEETKQSLYEILGEEVK